MDPMKTDSMTTGPMKKPPQPFKPSGPAPGPDPVPPAIKEPPQNDPEDRTPNAPVDEPDPVVPIHV
jgi:hypothetical protein